MNPTYSLEDEVADWLEQRGIGIVNETIFIGEIPADVPAGLLLVPLDVIPPHKYIDTEYPVIEFYYRSAHTDEAKGKMREVYNLLHRRGNYPLVNWYVYFSRALGSISDRGRDVQGGKLIRLSVQFMCRNLNNNS